MILVLVEPEHGVEPEDGHTAVLSLQALTVARSIATGGLVGNPEHLHAVVVGPHPDAMLAELAEQGVGTVHYADDPRLSGYSAAAWAAAVVDAARACEPVAVLAAASPRGNEVMAHVAARLDLPMAANCVTLESGTGSFLAARQVMGGAALEELRLDGVPALATLVGHVVDAEPAAAGPSSPQVRRFTPSLTEADLVARVVRVDAVPASGGALATARVVVGGGRGVGGAERFAGLLELVDLLGGALGVSRVVTSLGWRPHHEQVGQTGSRISPDLYIACGISGAIQHWAGCQSARTILAINTDAEAPMVTRAHYAVIGDLHEIVPAISAELRSRIGEPARA